MPEFLPPFDDEETGIAHVDHVTVVASGEAEGENGSVLDVFREVGHVYRMAQLAGRVCMLQEVGSRSTLTQGPQGATNPND